MIDDEQQLANMSEIVKIVNTNWIKWGESKCLHSQRFAETVKEKDKIIYRDGVSFKSKSECSECWQERKNEIERFVRKNS